ncbi:MAG: hypothetical protein J6V97_08820 [Prevotella sp.]|nr:hypothetical protein [Prevotella sp.]
MEMKKTRNLLMTIFSGALLLATLLYILGEFLNVDMGIFAETTREQRFICSTVMILLTIALLPLSLRLFKFKRISNDLQQRKAPALAKWGTLRLCVMGALLVVNTFLYYAFEMEPSYGYLAVVTLLCMPFVIPTMSRCEEEVKTPEIQEISDAPDNTEDSESIEEQESSEEEPA